MSIQFTRLKTYLLAFSIFAVVTPSAMAQESHYVNKNSVADTFEQAWLDRSGDIFVDQSMFTQLKRLIGLSYPEKEIAYNGEILQILYKDAIDQQVSSTPQIKTRDLKSPYNSSLLEGSVSSTSK